MKKGDRITLKPSSAIPAKAIGAAATIVKEPDEFSNYYQIALDMTPFDVWETDIEEEGVERATFTLGKMFPKVFPGDQRLVLYTMRAEMEPLETLH